MVVNQEIDWSKATEEDLHENHKDLYEKYKDIIKNYTKDEDVPETTEEDEEYENAVEEGYKIYSKKSEKTMKKSEGRKKIHPKDKWVTIVKMIGERETRGGKRRKQKRRTKKKSRKAKKKTKRSRK